MISKERLSGFPASAAFAEAHIAVQVYHRRIGPPCSVVVGQYMLFGMLRDRRSCNSTGSQIHAAVPADFMCFLSGRDSFRILNPVMAELSCFLCRKTVAAGTGI